MLCITFLDTLSHALVLGYFISLESSQASHVLQILIMRVLRRIYALLLAFVLFMVVISYPEKVRNKLLFDGLLLKLSTVPWLRAQVSFFGFDLFWLSWFFQWRRHPSCSVIISQLSYYHLILPFLREWSISKLISTSFGNKFILGFITPVPLI